jgi:hypothetical protein
MSAEKIAMLRPVGHHLSCFSGGVWSASFYEAAPFVTINTFLHALNMHMLALETRAYPYIDIFFLSSRHQSECL